MNQQRNSIMTRSHSVTRRRLAAKPELQNLEERTLLSTYNIGPGEPYTTLGSFNWSSLKPGDTVNIHWQSGGYHEKLLLSESGTASQPINIVGVPGPQGQQPVIDGQNATTSSQFQYFYNPLQENAVVLITHANGSSATPSYMNISNLEIKDAYDGYNFTDNTGATQTYSSFAASIDISGGSNITIQNCTLDSSGLGLFALTNDSSSLMTSNVMVEGNYFYNNGVPGSYGEHNSYCEVNGITYQYNYYGPLRSGSAGAELKDRSAGAVIRDNYFTPASAILDLVDAEDSSTLESLPSYTNTYVYGNILDDTGPNYTSLLVHFGGDSTNPGYRPNLYFYDNTVVTMANQSDAWRTCMFELDTTGQTAYVANNIFYNAAATSGDNPSLFEFSGGTGNVNFSPTNWVSPGWLTSESAEMGTGYSGTISGTGTFLSPTSNNAGFENLSGQGVSPPDNYQLVSGSSAIGSAGTIPSSWTTATGWPGLPTEQFVPPSTGFGGTGTARTSVADIGAYQAGSATPPASPPATPPSVTNETPTSGATNVAVSADPTATFSEAVQASSISFTLTNPSGSTVPGSVSYNSSTNVATFTPTSALANSTTYTATISAAQSSSGPVSAPLSWSFTTAAPPATPPAVTSETPASGATGAAVSTDPTATFNEAVQASTISFTLKSSSGSTVPGSVSYNSSTNVATFTPTSALANSTTYTATISAAQSSSGPVSAPFSWSFTTAAPPVTPPATPPAVSSETPASGATGVTASTALTATFNMAVQPSTIGFTLTSSSGSTMAGTVSCNSTTNVATFTPSSALANNTTYMATISGAKSTSGLSMAAPCSWSFTTAAASSASSTTSIWPSTAKPGTSTDSDTGSVEVGVQFTSDVSGSITGLKFFKGSSNTGTHVADLWTSSGKLLASATFTSETSSGWQQVNFAMPVAITAGTTYVASYHTNVGHYADDQNYFSAQYNSGSLHVPKNGGVYTYGPAGSFPTSTWNASNYWVDVVLSPSGSPSIAATAQAAVSGSPAVVTSSVGSLQTGNGTGVVASANLTAPTQSSGSAATTVKGQSLLANSVGSPVGRSNSWGQSALVTPIKRPFMSLGGSADS
ncbi:MAG: Ig-like domain-containing protein [Isosphaeraceae bacterium]